MPARQVRSTRGQLMTPLEIGQCSRPRLALPIGGLGIVDGDSSRREFVQQLHDGR